MESVVSLADGEEHDVFADSVAGSLRPAIRPALRDAVHDSILEMLLEERLRPGAPLRINTIAKDLDVSPTPVREALVQIEATGLISRTALKGYRVAAPLSNLELDKLMAVRILLEPAATRAAFDAQGEHLALPLARVLVRQRSAAAEKDEAGLREYIRVDIEFHNVILDHCDNPFLQRAVQSLGAQFHRFRQLSKPGQSDADYAIPEHQLIVDAFVSGDAQKAEQAMIEHLNAVSRRIQES